MYFIIGGDGKQYGPISGDDLRKWIAEGRLNAQSQAAPEGGAAWQPLSAFPEFADLFASTPRAGASPISPGDLTAGDYELDIGACISRGWELVKSNFWPAVGVSALIFILMIAFGQLTGLVTRPAIDGMVRTHQFSPGAIGLVLLVNILAAPVNLIFMAGLMKYFLNLARGEEATVGVAFSGFGQMIGQLFLLGLVSSLLAMIGYVLCIIPGLFLQVAWIFALPLVVDRRMNFWAAMELSRKMVCKHWFIVFAFFIVYSLVVLAGLIACCIGIFISMPIGVAAWVYAYESIFSRPQAG
jgi:hypothetical protein